MAQLVAGQRLFSVTLNAGGTFTFQVHDQTDGIDSGRRLGAGDLARAQGFAFSTRQPEEPVLRAPR